MFKPSVRIDIKNKSGEYTFLLEMRMIETKYMKPKKKK